MEQLEYSLLFRWFVGDLSVQSLQFSKSKWKFWIRPKGQELQPVICDMPLVWNGSN